MLLNHCAAKFLNLAFNNDDILSVIFLSVLSLHPRGIKHHALGLFKHEQESCALIEVLLVSSVTYSLSSEIGVM